MGSEGKENLRMTPGVLAEEVDKWQSRSSRTGTQKEEKVLRKKTPTEFTLQVEH